MGLGGLHRRRVGEEGGQDGWEACKDGLHCPYRIILFLHWKKLFAA